MRRVCAADCVSPTNLVAGVMTYAAWWGVTLWCYIVAQSQRSQATVPFLKAARRAICITGTPALSRPSELFQQVGGGICWGSDDIKA